ncbi:hypothetical protein [Actinoplanes solisilvae]|uniref:hypothetical protein n=1 Tax=Actinoplanes solisilvae TaxID=2486853 RepID=UPI000FD988D8|nr:hypothetical protein [Actinoplanes solisilvae]
MTAYEIAAKLPTIDVLRRRCQAVAVLDRIIDEGEPYYDFTTAWGDDEAASMRNGSGDEWNIVFTPEGAFIRVFAHESEMSPYGDDELALWPGLLDGLPAVFRTQVEEPAFNDLGQFVATAVLWRLAEDDRWNAGSGIDFPPSSGPIDIDPDGTGMLEILLDDIVDRYVDFAGHYYETEIDRAAVEHVVAHRPLTDAVVRTVNPEVSVAELSDDLTAIGYRPPAA